MGPDRTRNQELLSWKGSAAFNRPTDRPTTRQRAEKDTVEIRYQATAREDRKVSLCYSE
jgi:hypothetical protein